MVVRPIRDLAATRRGVSCVVRGRAPRARSAECRASVVHDVLVHGRLRSAEALETGAHLDGLRARCSIEHYGTVGEVASVDRSGCEREHYAVDPDIPAGIA